MGTKMRVLFLLAGLALWGGSSPAQAAGFATIETIEESPYYASLGLKQVVRAYAQTATQPDGAVAKEVVSCSAVNHNPFTYQHPELLNLSTPTWSAAVRCWLERWNGAIVADTGWSGLLGTGRNPLWSPVNASVAVASDAVEGEILFLCLQAGGYYAEGSSASFWNGPPRCIDVAPL